MFLKLHAAKRFNSQVLSSTVGQQLKKEGHDALSDFILQMDYWFDIMNTGLKDHQRKLKPHMAPFRDSNDERLLWLRSYPGRVIMYYPTPVSVDDTSMKYSFLYILQHILPSGAKMPKLVLTSVRKCCFQSPPKMV